MKPIRFKGKFDGPRVRDGLIICFYKQVAFGQWAESVAKGFEIWRESVPEEAIAHALVGSSASTVEPVGPRTLSGCLAQLDKKQAAKRKISGFRLGGPQKINPDYMFMVWGSLDAKRSKGNTKTCVVEMRFPTEMLDKSGDAFAELAVRLGRAVTFDSGYASLALHWSTDSELVPAAAEQVPLAMRHPGFDLHDSGSTRYGLGRLSRGARWLTFLGADLVEELGGRKSLEKKVEKHATVSECDDGLAVRVKGAPELGDVNRKQILPGEQAVAKAIEPVTLFGDEDLGRRVFADEQETRERWERRFLG